MGFDALLRGTDAECDGLSFTYQPEQWRKICWTSSSPRLPSVTL